MFVYLIFRRFLQFALFVGHQKLKRHQVKTLRQVYPDNFRFRWFFLNSEKQTNRKQTISSYEFTLKEILIIHTYT